MWNKFPQIYWAYEDRDGNCLSENFSSPWLPQHKEYVQPMQLEILGGKKPWYLAAPTNGAQPATGSTTPIKDVSNGEKKRKIDSRWPQWEENK